MNINPLWHNFAPRKRSPFYVTMYIHGFSSARRKILNFDYHHKLYFINGEIITLEREFQRMRKLILIRLKKDPQFLLNLLNEHYAYYKQICSKFWKQLSGLKVNRLTNKDLAKLLEKYADSVSEYWASGVTPVFVEQDLTDDINLFISKKLPEAKALKALQILTTPCKEGAVSLEYLSLLKIALLPKNQRAAAFKRHWNKFAWMANPLFTHTFFSLDYYKKNLIQLKRKNPRILLEHHHKERKNFLQRYKDLLKKLHPNRIMMLKIETLNEAIYYRSWRGEKAYESAFIVCNLLEECARRLSVSVKNLMYFTPWEIINWLKKSSHADINHIVLLRQKGFTYLPVKGGKILTGNQSKEWEKKIKIKIPKTDTIQGTTAFSGRIIGRACLVLVPEDFRKIQTGDILVTPSTTPAYVPILNRVKAIITEEGGVLSHASVISRELKIPCVIGTKIATKVLKDGDLVEVDANKGIVRKIK